jgi:S-adenosylmethionine decarboxylase
MTGIEWIVEAYGCDAPSLARTAPLESLFATLIRDLNLLPVAPAVWHRFPAPGGITGFCLLAESHLACHTFPEYGALCLNLFCCRPRPEWDFETHLKAAFRASTVRVRRISRPYRDDEPEDSLLPELRRAHSVPLV